MPKRSRKWTPRQVASKKRQRNGLKKRRQEQNPFNRIVAKNLHNAVLGQKVYGNTKNIGHSISRSIEKRKQTLLKEYTAIENNKYNTFIDKRYEKTLENKLKKLSHKKINKNKQQVEKIIKRLTSQRLKSNKKMSFNLDDTNDNTTLTHLGVPINEKEFNLNNFKYNDDDDNNKYLYKGFHKHNIYKMIKHKQMTLPQIMESAGINTNKYSNKTKPQIIKQHILRHRYKKCMDQIEREGIMNDTDIVDHQFKQTSKWLFAHRSNKNNNKNVKQLKKDIQYQEKLIEFEKDKRSTVTNATVTDTEKAQKNYEMLTKMESKRQHKLLADYDSDIEQDKEQEQEEQVQEQLVSDNDEVMEDKDTDWNEILEQIAQESSDSEVESYADNDNGNVNDMDGYYADIDTKFLPKNKGGVEFLEHGIEDIEIGCEPAGHGEESVLDIIRERDMEIKQNEIRNKLNKKRAISKDLDWNVLELNNNIGVVGDRLGDIPFTLDVPESMNEFEELMCDKTAEQQISLLKRMRSTNHIKLNEGNKLKMERLYDMLLDYFRKLCVNYSPSKIKENDKNKLKNDIEFYKYIDVITRALFALSHDIPEYAYSTHIKKIETISIHIQKNYKSYNNNNDNINNKNVSYMPSGYALFYLKLISSIFLTENKANRLITTVLLILCKCITNIKINGIRDIICYLYCITLILDIIKTYKRYVPEVIHSLNNVLNAGFISNYTFKSKKMTFNLLRETNDLYFTFCNGTNIWNELNDLKNINFNNISLQLPMRFIFLKTNNENILNTKEIKIQLLYTTLKIIFKCHEIWNSLLSYSEIFKPFYEFLNDNEIKMKMNGINSILLSDLYNNLLKCLQEKIFMQSLTRKPLQLIHKKRAIPSLEPAFDPDLKPSFLRMKVTNEKALEKKRKRFLKKAVKKQQKAVMKEFQKDTEFIMNEKTKHRIHMEHKREAKWQHEWHNLTEQQRDTNAFQMVGKKLKKKLMKQGVIRGF